MEKTTGISPGKNGLKLGACRTYDNLLRKSWIWSDFVPKAFGKIGPLFASKDPEICLKPVFSHYNSLSPTDS